MLIRSLVIDDFFDDPHAVRSQVLGFTFEAPPEAAYHPGRNAKERLALPGGDKLFSRLLHEPVAGVPDMGHCGIRLSLAGEGRKGDIHVDPGLAWSGIVYLSRPEDIAPQAGTQFFRHRATGWDRLPRNDEEARERFGIASRDEAAKTTIYRDGKDREKWDLVEEVPMRFNRCVLFRPWLFHAGGADFGSTPETGRLIQLLFFRPAS
jgi:hypothetical protein